MAASGVVLSIVLLGVCFITPGSTTCLIGCSCTDDDGGTGRSLLCMETAMARVPDNLPTDLSTIRIENSRLTELPRGSFSDVRDLARLWLNFNDIALMSAQSLQGLANLTELRLQGNKLRSMPWTAFLDAPKLKILDLKHNRLDVLPEHALRHLPGLTYLDVSFNRLSVVSKDVFLNWPLYVTTEKAWGKEGSVSNVVLALHDNPWQCDCRLKGFVGFIRAVSPPLILVNSYLRCAGPDAKAGKFFHEVNVKTCVKPVMTSALEANVSVALGARATLTCLAKARPEPTLHWTYSMKIIRGFSVTETHEEEERVSSELLIPSLHLSDRGLYTCTATNFLGNSSAAFWVDDPARRNASDPAPPPVSTLPPDDDENVRVDVRIAKQTPYGFTLEWHAATRRRPPPPDTWFTVHFGKHDAARKETIHIGPGVNSYSVRELQPLTRYEACVAWRNRPPLRGQCVAFVTGDGVVSAMEQRERLIHIVVIVCAMVLAVPAGMYACTTETRCGWPACCENPWKMRGEELRDGARRGTFDSLQGASNEGLWPDSAEGRRSARSGTEGGAKGGNGLSCVSFDMTTKTTTTTTTSSEMNSTSQSGLDSLSV
ncbi:unnamed protein product [Boreogadus saida]